MTANKFGLNCHKFEILAKICTQIVENVFYANRANTMAIFKFEVNRRDKNFQYSIVLPNQYCVSTANYSVTCTFIMVIIQYFKRKHETSNCCLLTSNHKQVVNLNQNFAKFHNN